MEHKTRRKSVKKNNKRRPPTRVGGKSVVAILNDVTPLLPARTRRSNMLYYEQDRKLSHVTGAKTDEFWYANSLFDPNVSGTGHQPIGFDQMMLLYEQFIVVKAKIYIEFVNTGASPAKVGVYLSPDAVATSDFTKSVENGLIKTKVVDCVASSGGTGNKITSMEMDFSTPRYFGRKSEQDCLDDPTLLGNNAGDPTEGAYFCVSMWGFPTGSSSTVYYSVTIAYDAWFTEPRKLASS